MPKTFEEFLEDRHAARNPQVLDDDMPDSFDDWLGQLDGEEYMDYAQKWGNIVYLDGKGDAFKESLEIVKK